MASNLHNISVFFKLTSSVTNIKARSLRALHARLREGPLVNLTSGFELLGPLQMLPGIWVSVLACVDVLARFLADNSRNSVF